MSSTFDPRRHPDTALPAAPFEVADRPTARLAARLLEDLDPICDEVVGAIRDRLTVYEAGGVPRDDLWWSVRANLDVLMRIIAEDRSLRPDEIRDRGALGVRRARQQLAVTNLIQAFQIGYIEVWRLLTDAAKAAGQEAVDDLVDVAGHFWAMMHLVSAQVAEAYHETSREEGADLRRRALAFVDLLPGLPTTATAARDEAHALGLDPDALVQAAVRRPLADDDPLRYREFGVVLVERPDTVVLLVNRTAGSGPGAADDGLFGDEPSPTGIGLARPGLEGALESIRDAQQAYDAARRLGRDRVRFRDDWFACTLASQLPRLQPLVADAVAALESDDHTAETIRAYLAADGKLVAAGEAVHVHPNTVKYRLERFAERTGVDPRNAGDMVDLSLALLLAGRPEPDRQA